MRAPSLGPGLPIGHFKPPLYFLAPGRRRPTRNLWTGRTDEPFPPRTAGLGVSRQTCSVPTQEEHMRKLKRKLNHLFRSVKASLDQGREAGMSTAEYAVGTLAACGFAGVLWVVVHSQAIHGLLQSVVERALNLAP